MSENRANAETCIEDVELAYDMAVAEAPFRELESLAAHHGLQQIVNQMRSRASGASRKVQREYMATKRALQFDVLTESGDIPSYGVNQFKLHWNKHAKICFTWVVKQIEQNPEIPMQAIPVGDDEYILQGDLLGAVEWFKQHGKGANSAVIILRRLHQAEKDLEPTADPDGAL